MNKKSFLEDLASLVRYHRLSGIEFYPRSEKIEELLTMENSKIERSTVLQQNTKRDTRHVAKAIQQASSSSASTLEEIADEISVCRICNLSNHRVVSVSGRGSVKAKLFIIGGWLTTESGVPYPQEKGIVFGVEEDIMLSKMMTAIHLNHDEFYVSNIIKCGVEAGVQPKAENVDACISYLHRQIARVSPAVICTMGRIATKAVLKLNAPLSQLRGKFQSYTVEEGRNIPVMVTYHPSFLLKNPEMKRAAWHDLQQIENELQKA